MKLLTINTHSLVEPDFEIKREYFARVILQEQPDIFADARYPQFMTYSVKEKTLTGLN